MVWVVIHHALPLEEVSYDIIERERCEDDPGHEWLSGKVRFSPLYLAVGDTELNVSMTGYHTQFERKKPNVIDASNMVLFSFREQPRAGVFIDDNHYIGLVMGLDGNPQPTSYKEEMVFHPSWNKTDWLRSATKPKESVILVVPELDVRTADLVTVRNKPTQQELERMGFQNVQVRRMATR